MAQASRRLAVTIVGGRAGGFRDKSAGAVVARSDGVRFWLKVSGLVGRARDMFRDVEIESDGLPPLPRPRIVAVTEWNDRDVFWRAVLMTLAPSPAVSLLPWCEAGTLHLSDVWLVDLRSALTKLRQARTQRSSCSMV